MIPTSTERNKMVTVSIKIYLLQAARRCLRKQTKMARNHRIPAVMRKVHQSRNRLRMESNSRVISKSVLILELLRKIRKLS